MGIFAFATITLFRYALKITMGIRVSAVEALEGLDKASAAWRRTRPDASFAGRYPPCGGVKSTA